MMLSGEPVTSEYALGIGLVNEVVAAEELDARVEAFARTLASGSAPALAAIKRLVYEGIELPLAAALQVERAALPEILGSRDYSEGLAAFAASPRFMEWCNEFLAVDSVLKQGAAVAQELLSRIADSKPSPATPSRPKPAPAAVRCQPADFARRDSHSRVAGVLEQRPGPGGGLCPAAQLDLLAHSLSVYLRFNDVPFVTVLQALR
jgi:hypothetical protein